MNESKWIVPDAQLSNLQLRAMTAKEIWDFFKPHMRRDVGQVVPSVARDMEETRELEAK